ncbi:hypothetical protein [Umezawaea beigongshangensis]|uniref:hypothetical protein n=1 Tax=Umezawaea beigongshangensis TaxID=2780383 RepID=UPI0018F1F876|nr:hypothetical protein [Umezawaea beigongshangensis]
MAPRKPTPPATTEAAAPNTPTTSPGDGPAALESTTNAPAAPPGDGPAASESVPAGSAGVPAQTVDPNTVSATGPASQLAPPEVHPAYPAPAGAVPVARTGDPMIAALLRERAGYVGRGMDKRVADVDEQLRARGYTPSEHDQAPRGGDLGQQTR